jgi:hypothetical protein
MARDGWAKWNHFRVPLTLMPVPEAVTKLACCLTQPGLVQLTALQQREWCDYFLHLLSSPTLSDVPRVPMRLPNGWCHHCAGMKVLVDCESSEYCKHLTNISLGNDTPAGFLVVTNGT